MKKEMMKEVYERSTLNITVFDKEDVIATSGEIVIDGDNNLPVVQTH